MEENLMLKVKAGLIDTLVKEDPLKSIKGKLNQSLDSLTTL
jgi:hypothetical protein